jgi:hypothetical protein
MNVKQNIAQILGSGLTKVCAICLLTNVQSSVIMEKLAGALKAGPPHN